MNVQPPPPPFSPPPPVAPVKQRRSWKTWQVAVAAVAGLMLGIGAGGASTEPAEGEDAVGELRRDLRAAETRADQAENRAAGLEVQLETAQEIADRPTTTAAPATPPPPTEPPQPVEVARFEGASNTQTANFTVTGTWTMVGSVSGGAGINVDILNTAGQTVDFLGFDEGENTSQFRQGGTFYLDISTFGSTYSVVIIDEVG